MHYMHHNLGVARRCIPPGPRRRRNHASWFLDRFEIRMRRGKALCRTKHCLSSAGNSLYRCRVAAQTPGPADLISVVSCLWRASRPHVALLHTFCAQWEGSSTSSGVPRPGTTPAVAACLDDILSAHMQLYKTKCTYWNIGPPLISCPSSSPRR